MLWGENSAEWVATFFGCALAGVIVVPMDDKATPDFAQRVFQQVGGETAFLLQAALDGVCRNRSLDSQLDRLKICRRSFWPTHPAPTVPLSPDDTLQIVFTSGTTAEPKGVVITHGNVLANIAPARAARFRGT